ncbi:hypothetical protein SAMN04488000_12520 [Lentzea albida]|uniref:Uncharacterized protein n=1 Tax=Lentzea albida TaxID=65499 RepID=A0A1H9WVQ0_9PSEU|nr:hypothetical protein SAMN04488000_12520 [Lentzea albida]
MLGLAVRIPTESGDWDLLLSSAGTGRWTRMLPKFARRWQNARLGTLLPYRYRGELVWFTALPGAGEPPERFTLHASGRDGGLRQVAELTLHHRETEPVAFDPVLTLPPELELAPRWFARLRAQAYRGSRLGRRGS